VVDTYISARVVHSRHPRVPVLKVWHFYVRIARPKTRALAQRASARQTRARHHRPRTLPFRSRRRPVGAHLVGALGDATAVTHRRIVVVTDIVALVHGIRYDEVIKKNYYKSDTTAVFKLYNI